MGIDKLAKFSDLNTMTNVLQNHDYHQPQLIDHTGLKVNYKGKWQEEFFNNKHPIVLELACGRGEYTVGLAALYPNKNFIGFDLKGNRMWTGATKALKSGLTNVAFVRTKIELLTHFFDKQEVDEIWIIFPDPFKNHTSANRRLTSPVFLEKYKAVCKPGATINLKTDDDTLHQYTLKIIKEYGYQLLENNENVYANGETENSSLAIQTYYENMHLKNKKTIKYLKFSL